MVRLMWQVDGWSQSDRNDRVRPAAAAAATAAAVVVLFGLSTWELCTLSLIACLVCLILPRSACLIASIFRLALGTLYPAYASYKAVRTKDVKEYVSLE